MVVSRWVRSRVVDACYGFTKQKRNSGRVWRNEFANNQRRTAHDRMERIN
jgi:hypothetical protein